MNEINWNLLKWTEVSQYLGLQKRSLTKTRIGKKRKKSFEKILSNLQDDLNKIK